MFTKTLHNEVNSTKKIEEKFEEIRRDYNRDLTKLRKKYKKAFISLANDYDSCVVTLAQ